MQRSLGSSTRPSLPPLPSSRRVSRVRRATRPLYVAPSIIHDHVYHDHAIAKDAIPYHIAWHQSAGDDDPIVTDEKEERPMFANVIARQDACHNHIRDELGIIYACMFAWVLWSRSIPTITRTIATIHRSRMVLWSGLVRSWPRGELRCESYVSLDRSIGWVSSATAAITAGDRTVGTPTPTLVTLESLYTPFIIIAN